ncbi:MAG: hypothetical protein ABI863_22750 [Ginsengibacter sp.]
MTHALEVKSAVKLRADEIQKVLQEDGQLIELKLLMEYKKKQLRFLVVDGMHVNILSNNYEIAETNIVGDFGYLALDLFNPPTPTALF